jgi:hypothetical protein
MALSLSAALSSCSSSSSSGGTASCAAAGTYHPTMTRSLQNPGSCPLDLQFPEVLNSLDVPAGRFCGPDELGFDDYDSSGCADQGQIVLSGSSSGISGTLSATITACPGSGPTACTANYDVVYSLGGSDAGTNDAATSDGG